MKKHEFRQETAAVHGGANLAKKNGPLSTPIYQTSTFEVTDMQEQVRATPTDRYYTRYGNPTNTAAENAVARCLRSATSLGRSYLSEANVKAKYN